MFVRVKTRPHTNKKAVQIVKSIREGKSVKQKVVQTIGYAFDDETLEKLKDIAEHVKQKLLFSGTMPLFPLDKIAKKALQAHKKQKDTSPLNVDLKKIKEKERFITGIHDVYGKVYHHIGFDKVLTKRSQTAHKELFHTVMARLATPLSKRASVKMLQEDFGIQLDLAKVYRMMDKIDDKAIQKIQKAAYATSKSLFRNKIKVLFYDCTTLYFESFKPDELKQNGYSKDGKFNQPQVLLALLVTEAGLPIGYEVFPGATFEGNTLKPIINKLKKEYDLDDLIFVADSAMLSNKNREYLREKSIKFIVGARLKNLPKNLHQQVLSHSHIQEQAKEKKKKINILGEFEYKNCKLITYYSEKRARKDAKDRQKNLEKLQKKLKASQNPSSLISKFGYQQYITLSGETSWDIDEEKIQKAALWDGIGGVMTNVDNLEATKIIEQYKNLWQIEACFRMKKFNNRIRPIYHWTPKHVKAHIAICFMAFTCQKYLHYRLNLQKKPLSIEEIRNALVHVQLSILYDTSKDCYYGLPSKKTDHAKSMYKLLDVKHDITPFFIPSNEMKM